MTFTSVYIHSLGLSWPTPFILVVEEIIVHVTNTWDDFQVANQRKGDEPSNSRASSPTLFTLDVAILLKSVLCSINLLFQCA